MFYSLFSRLVPSQPLQNASHHIRNKKEIPGDKSQWNRFNYSFFFFFHWPKYWFMSTVSRPISWKCQNEELPLKTLGGTAIPPAKHFYRLPKDLEKKCVHVLLFKQNSSHMKHIRISFVSCLIRAHTHFTVTHQGRAAHWDAITHKNNVKKFTGKT